MTETARTPQTFEEWWESGNRWWTFTKEECARSAYAAGVASQQAREEILHNALAINEQLSADRIAELKTRLAKLEAELRAAREVVAQILAALVRSNIPGGMAVWLIPRGGSGAFDAAIERARRLTTSEDKADD